MERMGSVKHTTTLQETLPPIYPSTESKKFHTETQGQITLIVFAQ